MVAAHEGARVWAPGRKFQHEDPVRITPCRPHGRRVRRWPQRLCPRCAPRARPAVPRADGAADAKLAVDVALRRAVAHAGCGSSRLRSLANITRRTASTLTPPGGARRAAKPPQLPCPHRRCQKASSKARRSFVDVSVASERGKMKSLEPSAALQVATETTAVSCLFRICFTNGLEDVLLTQMRNPLRAG